MVYNLIEQFKPLSKNGIPGGFHFEDTLLEIIILTNNYILCHRIGHLYTVQSNGDLQRYCERLTEKWKESDSFVYFVSLHSSLPTAGPDCHAGGPGDFL